MNITEYDDRVYDYYAQYIIACDSNNGENYLESIADETLLQQTKKLIVELHPTGDCQPPDTERYHFLELISKGGMGNVYRAEDRLFNRIVAIKVMRNKLGISAKSFKDEAVMLGKLNHPCIIPVYDHGTLPFPDGRPFFAMKIVDGKTLESILSKPDKPLSIQEMLRVFIEVCQAVSYAHNLPSPLIHRDLKPSNIMLASFGEVQVMDWGIAKYLTESDSRTSKPESIENLDKQDQIKTTYTSQHNVSMLKGTLSFMPPEQAIGDANKISKATDVFALGGILCQMLTGLPTYVGDEQRKAQSGDLVETFNRLDKCNHDSTIISLAKDMLNPDASKRIHNVEYIINSIVDYQNQLTQKIKQAEIKAAKRKLQLALASSIFFAVIGTIVFFGWIYLQKQKQIIDDHYRDDKVRANIKADLDTGYELIRSRKFNESRSIFTNSLHTASTLSSREDLGIETAISDLDTAIEIDRIRFSKWIWTSKTEMTELSFKNTSSDYSKLFQKLGFNISSLDQVDIKSFVRRSRIKSLLILAIDDWAINEKDMEVQQSLLTISNNCDDDQWMRAIRDKKLWKDTNKLQEYADQFAFSKQTPEHLCFLIELLSRVNLNSFQLIYNGRLHYPNNFDLAMIGGTFLVSHAKKTKDMKNATAAMRMLEAARSLNPENAAATFNLAVMQEDIGDWDGAITLYNTLDANPALINSVAFNLAMIYEKKKDFDMAIANYSKAIEANQFDDESYNHLGLCWREKKDFNKALQYCKKACELNPRSYLAYNNVGVIYKDADKYSEAIEYFQLAIKLNPDYGVSYYNLAHTYEKTKQFSLAIKNYVTAIDKDSTLRLACEKLAMIYLNQEKFSEAIKYFNRALQLDPKLEWININLGVCHLNTSPPDPATAIEHAKRAIQLNPNSYGGYELLGESFKLLGDDQNAKKAFDKAKTLKIRQ